LSERQEAGSSKKRSVADYAVGAVSCLLIVLPAALGFLYVRAFGVSVVFADAWSMVSLFKKWSAGRLEVSDLLRQSVVHRMFFPKGVELWLGNITKYNTVAEMYLIEVCFLVTLVILLLAFIDNVNIRSSWLFLFLPVSLLIFSLSQWQNMLYGYQINFAFVETFGVLALFLLYVLGRRSNLRKLAFAAALASATVASYSVLAGLFVWPAGLVQLCISPLEKRQKRWFVALWGLVGIFEWVVYFIGWRSPGSNSSLLYILEQPLQGTNYYLRLLGSSLFWTPNSALAGGLLVACLALVSLLRIHKDRRFGEYSFWISLLLFSLLILASIMVGRSFLQMVHSRYTTFSVLAVVSVYAMLVKTALEKRSMINTVLLTALAGAVLLSASISYPNGIAAGREWRAYTEQGAFVLSMYESQPDEALGILHPQGGAFVRSHAPTLQRLGYNVFSEQQASEVLPPPLSDLSSVTSSTPYSQTVFGKGVSQENGSFVVPEGTAFIWVAGWAVDADNGSTAGGVYIDIDGKHFPAFYGTDRQDVADRFGVRSYRYSGFVRAISVSEIGAGTHELSVVVLTSDEKGYFRPDQKLVLKVG
jgi:hypothetical protein